MNKENPCKYIFLVLKLKDVIYMDSILFRKLNIALSQVRFEQFATITLS